MRIAKIKYALSKFLTLHVHKLKLLKRFNCKELYFFMLFKLLHLLLL